MSTFLDELSAVQRQAVVNYQGPALIIAGAGSGKTRVLTYRIAYTLQQGVPPYTVLALTFTNKAAREMKERIGALIGNDAARRLWMGTFHSIFARILRREAEYIGYPSSFSIYDAGDTRTLLKTCIKELRLDEQRYKVSAVAGRISMAKNSLIRPEEYAADPQIQEADRLRKCPSLHEIYALYARRCKQAGAMDFDDLLLNTNVLFRRFPDVLSRYHGLFNYILVDEYQDTNYAQYIIIKRLSQILRNLCVVGDDSQSIYSFRGARIENILNFRHDYPDYKEYRLEENYRSTQTIVNAANNLIEKNSRQLRKKCFSSGAPGEKIGVIQAFTDQEESFMVASSVAETVYTRRIPYSEFAVLYRTNAQSRAFEEAFRKKNIPYKVYGGLS
ncbi:MAG: UvrD-helicase domain-containing protein, partial [Prevotellaceae bacterium]|nr:UvrD-helicase domain-containing protein [Prevotellaceae bacterium]